MGDKFAEDSRDQGHDNQSHDKGWDEQAQASVHRADVDRLLLVCSGGGHLKQLFSLAQRLGVPPERQHWVTFRNGLSESLLRDRSVSYIPFVGPRQVFNYSRALVHARRILRSNEFSHAVSTGSSPALAFLPQVARQGGKAAYIESAARADGPSLTGKIIANHFPSVQTFTQYPSWADDRWAFRGSIYDEFEPGPAKDGPSHISRAVVSTGTQRDYTYERLLGRLGPLLHEADVLWQTTDNNTEDRFGFTSQNHVPHHDMQEAIAESDVVVCHAGTGAILTAMESGKCPVVAPRLKAHGEHIDDHQVQIAREMSRRGLAISISASGVTSETLVEAASRSVVRKQPPPLELFV